MNEKLLVVRKLNSNFFRIYYSHNMPITHITHESLPKDLFSVIQNNWNQSVHLTLSDKDKFDGSKFSERMIRPLEQCYSTPTEPKGFVFHFHYIISKVNLKL